MYSFLGWGSACHFFLVPHVHYSALVVTVEFLFSTKYIQAVAGLAVSSVEVI